jgi:hypothetical protein
MTAHSPTVIDNIKRNLVGLKMPRALEILDVTVRGIERGEMTDLEAIDVLLTEELILRENRRVKMALLMARSPQRCSTACVSTPISCPSTSALRLPSNPSPCRRP